MLSTFFNTLKMISLSIYYDPHLQMSKWKPNWVKKTAHDHRARKEQNCNSNLDISVSKHLYILTCKHYAIQHLYVPAEDTETHSIQNLHKIMCSEW